MATVLAAVFATDIPADQWPAPRIREVFSESREFFVRVTPGKSYGDLAGFASSNKGPWARAELYRRHADRSYKPVAGFALLNPVAPVEVFVTGEGYVVTLDNWHNAGYGKVLVSYSPAGVVVKAYELADLFSPEEIAAFMKSASSINWRSGALYLRSPEQTMLHVTIDSAGRSLTFDSVTGGWQACEWRQGEFLCRTANPAEKWAPFRER